MLQPSHGGAGGQNPIPVCPLHPEDMLLFWNGWSGYAEAAHPLDVGLLCPVHPDRPLAQEGSGATLAATALQPGVLPLSRAVLGWQQSLAESKSGGFPLGCHHWRAPLFPWPSAKRLPGVGGRDRV